MLFWLEVLRMNSNVAKSLRLSWWNRRIRFSLSRVETCEFSARLFKPLCYVFNSFKISFLCPIAFWLVGDITMRRKALLFDGWKTFAALVSRLCTLEYPKNINTLPSSLQFSIGSIFRPSVASTTS